MFTKLKSPSLSDPFDGKNIGFWGECRDLSAISHFPFPHIILHEEPLHAAIAFIDSHFQIREIEGCGYVGAKLEIAGPYDPHSPHARPPIWRSGPG